MFCFYDIEDFFKNISVSKSLISNISMIDRIDIMIMIDINLLEVFL